MCSEHLWISLENSSKNWKIVQRIGNRRNNYKHLDDSIDKIDQNTKESVEVLRGLAAT